MPLSFRLGFMVATMAIALPGLAAAQSTTAFDGTYAGVSMSASGNRSCVPPAPVPRPLTISKGAAQFAGGMTGDNLYQGTVDAQGGLTMRAALGQIFTGKIDPSGKITGGSSGGGNCLIISTWQKR